MAEVVPSCTGACCAAFWLPYTPEDLRKRAAEAKEGSELPYIADMVIPLSARKANARVRQYGLKWPKVDSDEADQVFTCRHWDEETRRCQAYEARPQMCRDYPYAEECKHCGFRETESIQADWRAMHGGEFDWVNWRWNRKLGGYHAIARAPDADWEPGDAWRWDGTLLRPEHETQRWSPRRRRWEAKT
jgi:Fe-S-cluster containining protein